MITRRSALGSLMTAGSSTSLLRAQAVGQGQTQETASSNFSSPNVVRTPDYVAALSLDGMIPLNRSGSRWNGTGISIQTQLSGATLPVMISAPAAEPVRIHLRWNSVIAGDPLLLGDAWERSYGGLAWQSIVPQRVMPWYFLMHDKGITHGIGVKTGAAALCFWQVDGQGVSLWLDVSNGGSGVKLGDRELCAAIVTVRKGSRDETAMEAAHAFCQLLCPKPRLYRSPIYGSNDWYYAYGKNSAEQTLRDADLMAALSPGNKTKPFTVIDGGWEEGSKRFPSMSELARQIDKRGVRPGIWIRPLIAPNDAPAHLLIADARFGKLTERAQERAYDPTIPEALDLIAGKVTESRNWGYALIKHDFSTYDLLGKWGREMGPNPTFPGWHLYDRSRTNAEVIRDLYTRLRKAAGEEVVLIGCNTVGQLGAGLFEAQRTGDDTSGKVWERTRRMGINTLAYRLPQHNTFFAVDADCVGITEQIPWALNRQFLDLIANTGTTLFISPGPTATGSEQREAIRAAFARVEAGRSSAAPEDWFRDAAPERWLVKEMGHSSARRLAYKWLDASGCSPFDV